MARGIVALLASAALVTGGEVSVAHDASSPTSVVIVGMEVVAPDRLAVSGYVDAPPACSAGRELEISARYGEWTHRRHVWAPGAWEPADEVRAAQDGSFTAYVSEPGLWSVKVVAPRVSAGRREHRHVCGKGKASLRN